MCAFSTSCQSILSYLLNNYFLWCRHLDIISERLLFKSSSASGYFRISNFSRRQSVHLFINIWVVLSIHIPNFPNLSTNWCIILIILVSEWFCVIIISSFPFLFCYAYINLLGFCWFWCCALIKSVFHSASPLYQTISFSSTITRKFLTFNCLNYVPIVAPYYLETIFKYFIATF